MDDQAGNDLHVTHEIEHGHEAYTDEELFDQARLNAQALLLATAHTLGGDAAALEAWTRGVADIFLRAWDREREWRAAEVLDALLTNYRSLGASVIAADLEASPATATIAELPEVGLVETLGLADADADAVFAIGAHLARALGHELTWARDTETGDVRLAGT